MASLTPLPTPPAPPTVPQLPLSRLLFLQSTAPDSLKPLISSLSQQHSDATLSVAAPELSTAAQTQETHHLILTNNVAEHTNEDPHLTRGIAAQAAGLKDVRDVARKFSHQQMATMIPTDERDVTTSQGLPVLKAPNSESPTQTTKAIPKPVLELQKKLFHQYPSSVVSRMVDHGEIHLGNHAPSEPNASVTRVGDKSTSGTVPTTGPATTNTPLKDSVVQFL